MAPGRLCSLLALLFALGAMAFELETGPHSNEVVFEPSSQEYLDSSPGILPGSLISCERVRVPGISRWRNAFKFAHTSRVSVAPRVLEIYSRKIQVCFHENFTLESCQCGKENWKSLEKGNLIFIKSPFQTKLLDVRAVGSLGNAPTVSVTVTEEFSLPRILFFVLGVVLLVTAPIVSSWVPFYYSSAMTMGILLVVIILLFQAMKLLPTGKRSSLYLILYGSAVGIGTVVIKHVANILAPLFYQLGIGDDMQRPVVYLCVLGVIVSGAYFGYLGVRKFVLTNEGEVDIGTAKFVKWALRLLASLLLLLSSLDPVFSVLTVLIGALIAFTPVTIFENLELPPWPSRNSDFEGWRYRHHIKMWKRKQQLGPGPSSSTYHSPVSNVSGKRVFVSPPSRYKMSPEQAFYSSYHKTPERKKMSSAEFEAIARDCTMSSMQSLVSSPKFSEWIVHNADRISVMPNVARQERPEDEIESTGKM